MTSKCPSLICIGITGGHNVVGSAASRGNHHSKEAAAERLTDDSVRAFPPLDDVRSAVNDLFNLFQRYAVVCDVVFVPVIPNEIEDPHAAVPLTTFLLVAQ
jgi:hypothetical protein